MKLKFIFCLLLCASAVQILPAADRITIQVLVTNTPAQGATFTLNGDTRTWTTNKTLASQILLSSGQINGNATNLFNAVSASPFTGPVTLRLATSGSIKLTGTDGLAMSATVSSAWGYAVYTTNAVTSAEAVRVALASEPTATVRTNHASEIVKGINSYATNRFDAGIMDANTITNFTFNFPWLANLSSTGNSRIVSTNSNKIAINVYTDNNGIGITNHNPMVVTTNGTHLIYGAKTFVTPINATSNLHLGSVTHFIESDGYTQLAHAAINTNSVWRIERANVYPHLILMDPSGNLDFNIGATGAVNSVITFITPLSLKPEGTLSLSGGTDGSISDSIQVGDRTGNADIAIYRNVDSSGANGSLKWYAKGASATKSVQAQMKFEQTSGGSGASDIVLMTHNGTSLAERARLKSTGRLGLQTNAPAATLHNYGSSILGTNGTVFLDRISANFTFDPPSIDTVAQFTTNVTMTGATVGSDVKVTPSTEAMGGIIYDGYVSGVDTVTIRLNNYTALLVDPTNQAHRVTVVTYP